MQTYENNFKEDIYGISTKIEDFSKEIDKKLVSIVEKPLYKKILFKFSKNRQLKELENVFDFFKGKTEELHSCKNELLNLKDILENENKSLDKEMKRLKRQKQPDKEILVQIETKLVINSEILMNEIPILIDMIEVILTKLAKTLPFIERTIKQRLVVNGSLKTLQFVIKKTIELEEYSKSLEKENSQMIKKMVTSSNEMIVNSIDINYYKDMKKRNEELAKLFMNSKAKYHKKMEQMEKELSGIIDRSY